MTSDATVTTAPPRIDWRRSYARRLAVSDLLVIAWAVFGAEMVLTDHTGVGATFLGLGETVGVPITLLSLLLIAGWMVELTMQGTRDHRIIGSGADEYKRIADAAVRLFGIVAIVALLLKIDFARSFLLLSFPIGLLALLITRWLWRQWLTVQRARGLHSSRLLLVGTPTGVDTVAAELMRRSTSGYVAVGAWLRGEGDTSRLADAGIAVMPDHVTVTEAMQLVGADTVAVVNSGVLGRNGVNELSWQLEPGRQHLILAPDMVDVGGPRLLSRPVAGLPLIHIETPRYEAANRFAKRAFDLVVTSIVVTLLSPVLLALALLVRAGGPGPVLFRQERVGLNGRPFTMLKFRSMVVDAEQRLADLLDTQRSEGNAVLFKMKDDPRVTPIGRIMRRFSLDELPQLFNVLAGSMSLVGPRPPLPREVELYENHVHRRFLVKPGITGLWQVSGRSNLTWEQTVRLDLTYVQNWSLIGDLHILWRTFRAMVRRDGAY